ncbi:MAG: 3-oxoacyl-ACP reductase FabG [Bdellovibrionales bacterium]|nr:3-oxoacyl-ACP reductase FabG [Bdellovibrionales bacterium]
MSQSGTVRPIALVTGASRGIGAGIAQKLGTLGFHVMVNYVSNEAKAQEVCAAITAAGGSAEPMRFDVSSEAEIVSAFDTLAKKGALEVLVNNAGISEDGLILRMKKETLDRTLQTNLVSAVITSREAAKLMMRARRGSIINITSVVGEMGNAGQVAYAAAKAGLHGLTKSLAKELASRSIRVNAVAPGYIETDMTGALTDVQKKSITDNIPLGSLGTPQDVAEIVGFLSTNGSRYITGQIIGVNGGLYI